MHPFLLLSPPPSFFLLLPISLSLGLVPGLEPGEKVQHLWGFACKELTLEVGNSSSLPLAKATASLLTYIWEAAVSAALDTQAAL